MPLQSLVAIGPGWLGRVHSILPGAHAAVVTDRVSDAIDGRMAGLELRDTLLILGGVFSYVFLFRAPLAEDSVGRQVLTTGTGGINIVECRRKYDDDRRPGNKSTANRMTEKGTHGQLPHYKTWGGWTANSIGRYPSNVLLLHDNSCGTSCSLSCSVRRIDYRAKKDEALAPSQFYPVFTGLRELIVWLDRLVTPPVYTPTIETEVP